MFPGQVSQSPVAIAAVNILNQPSADQLIYRPGQPTTTPEAALIASGLAKRQPVNRQLQPLHAAMRVNEKPVQHDLGIGAGVARCAERPPGYFWAALDVLCVDFLQGSHVMPPSPCGLSQ